MENEEPTPRSRSKAGCLPLVLGISLLAGAVVGGGYVFEEEAAGATFSNRVIDRTDNLYRTQGLAIGGRWRTHFAFSSHLREVLERTPVPFDASPADNVVADMKTRNSSEPYIRSFLLELGKLQIRYEDVYIRIDNAPNSFSEFHGAAPDDK